MKENGRQHKKKNYIKKTMVFLFNKPKHRKACIKKLNKKRKKAKKVEKKSEKNLTKKKQGVNLYLKSAKNKEQKSCPKVNKKVFQENVNLS